MRNIFLCMLGLAVASSALAAGSDELWDMTAKMEMPGMPMAMPAMKSKTCIPKNGAYAPKQDNQDCQESDVRVSGNTIRWKMRCTGKEPMEGSGEMTRTADMLKGTIKINSRQGEMTQILDGKRIGTCDAAVVQKQREQDMQQMKGEAAKLNNDMCANLSEMEANSSGFDPGVETSYSQQKGPCASFKPVLCEKAKNVAGTYEGYDTYVKNKGWVIKACGINLQAKHTALCKQAGAEKKYAYIVKACPEVDICKIAMSDTDNRKYGVIGRHCPAEAQALAKQHCDAWGRDYTSDHDNEYSPICAKYSKNKSSYEVADDQDTGEASADSASDKGGLMGKLFGGSSKDSAAAKKDEKSGAGDNPAGAVLDGAKKLKGLFGF